MRISVLKVYDIDEETIQYLIDSDSDAQETVDEYIKDNFGDDFVPGPGYNDLIDIIYNEKRNRLENI